MGYIWSVIVRAVRSILKRRKQLTAILGPLGAQGLPLILCNTEAEKYLSEGGLSSADVVPFCSLLHLWCGQCVGGRSAWALADPHGSDSICFWCPASACGLSRSCHAFDCPSARGIGSLHLGPSLLWQCFCRLGPAQSLKSWGRWFFDQWALTCATKAVQKLVDKNKPLFLAVLIQVDEGPRERRKKKIRL